MSTTGNTDDNTAIQLKQHVDALKCCRCIRTTSGIKIILCLEFLVTFLLAAISYMAQHADERFFFTFAFLISFASFFSGSITICKKKDCRISVIFNILFAVATIEFLNAIIFVWSFLLYHMDSDPPPAHVWFIAFLFALYGMLRIYFMINIYKHHHHIFPNNVNTEHAYNKQQMIAIVLCEFILCCVILTVIAAIQFGDPNIYKTVILSRACYWCFAIIFASFVFGVLAVSKQLNNHKTISILFFVFYFIGTVQWFNYFFTFQVFDPDVFPGMWRRIPHQYQNNQYLEPGGSAVAMAMAAPRQASGYPAYQNPYDASARRILMMQRSSDANTYGSEYLSHDAITERQRTGYDIVEQNEWTPQQIFDGLLSITVIIYACIRVYFNGQIYKYSAYLE